MDTNESKLDTILNNLSQPVTPPLFSAMLPISALLLEAQGTVRAATSAIYQMDGHSNDSYRYMSNKMEQINLLLCEVSAHLAMIGTGAPSHASYIGGSPIHKYQQRNPHEDLN